MKMHKRPVLNDETGQSTIEFALTLLLLMGMVLFYLQLSLVMAFGNYAHYATFMAARAYLAAGPSKEDQSTRARQVIVRMLKKSEGMAGVDRFPSIAKGDGAGDPKGFQLDHSMFNATDQNLSWMQGVRYTFKSRLFMIPLGRGGGASSNSQNSANSVNLTSESWLGREPSSEECKAEMSRTHGMIDNGC